MNLFGKKTTIAVHDGKFHADDIFACAVLQILLDGKAKIIRTRDPKIIEQADYAVDVGCINDASQKRFDHHMPGGAGIRENGIPYASVGLVWKAYGLELSGSKEISERVDDRLFAPIDANDNGVSLMKPIGTIFQYDIQSLLGAFRPTWKEDPDMYDESFFELVELAKKIVKREIKIAHDIILAEGVIEEAYAKSEDKRVIETSIACPFQDALLKHPEVLYVVHPRFGDSKWAIYAVHVSPNGFENRKSLPASWAGLRDEELAKVTGVPGSVFCHNGRFLAVAQTRETALALVKIALEA